MKNTETQKPACAWSLADIKKIPSNGIKVMSTFACGGGSSMGYKLAGCEVVAANDIDPEMAWHYKKNIDPPLYYLCPIRDLLTKDLPEQLFNLDILDGSPPCSTFSMAGSREKAWGKEKHFREGQAKQVLSDLFFDFLDLVEHLNPKVVVAENVKGMIMGNAKGYTKLVMQRLRDLGYRPQLFLVNAADCGVPQMRERVFFVAVRSDIDVPPLVFSPKKCWVKFKDAVSDVQDLTQEEIKNTKPGAMDIKVWPNTRKGGGYDEFFAATENVVKCFTYRKLHEEAPACTLTATHSAYSHPTVCRKLSIREWQRLGSFPDDYQFKTHNIGKYMIGMSVPPRMTEQVARAVVDQWLK